MRGFEAPRLVFSAVLAASLCPGAGAQQDAQAELRRAAEEFKVQSRNLGLRQDAPRRGGRARSAPVQFHGRLTHNLRNDALDATPHDVNQRGGDKNILRRNQFGFNVSGPLVIPKLYDGARRTFFSVSYEGVREKIGRSYLRTIPIVPERTGDFSQTVDAAGDPLRIFDPATTRPNPLYNPSAGVSASNLQFLRGQFPGNRMPVSRLDPVAARMAEYYPLPNSDAGPFFRNNLFVFAPEVNTADGMILKVDHNFRQKQRLAVTGSFTNGIEAAARFYNNPANPGSPDRDYANRRISTEHVYTLSPQTINTFSIEASSNISDTSVEQGDFAAQIGLNGVPGGSFPFVLIDRYLGLGRSNPIARHARHAFVTTNGLALRKGKHNLRLTAQFVRSQVNTSLPQYPTGYFRFTSGLTSLPGIVNTGHGFASMLMGMPQYVEVSYVGAPSYFRGSRGFAALGDNWEIRPGLNVSFGLNLEFSGPRTDRYNRMSTVDFNAPNPASSRPGALIFAGLNGAGRAFQPVQTRWQPGFNMAWNPGGNRKAVLRYSIGLGFQGYPMPSGQWGTQGFNGYATYFSQNPQLDPALILATGVPAPAYPIPDLRPDAANQTSADLNDMSGALPRNISSGLSYERELPFSIVLTASASISSGRNVYVGNNAVNPNAVHPDNLHYRDLLNDESFIRELRPFPQYLRFDTNGLWAGGRFRRTAAAIRVEKRTSQGLALSANAEFSRQFDDYSGPYGKQDFFNRRNEWSLTPWNNPIRLSLSYMYELPVGIGKNWFSYQDWRRWIISGWSVSGMSSISSGEPIALHPMFNNTGGVIQALRVNTVDGVDPHVRNQSPELWFNPDAFSHPADFTLGSGPRTHSTLRNPSTQSNDLSFAKRVSIDQERAFEFTASAFNFVNLGIWNDPDNNIGTADSPNVNAGRIIGSRGGRVIQLGLRFSF
ncbi:MAG: hypothetical protein C0504_09125 [Candidatus Solibacter sp.]|nr:hypothetical protein [Candidatus Solibacter sp.]